MGVAGDLVLADQPGAKQQRVVGAEGDAHSGVEQGADRDHGRGRGHAERDVGDGAHFEGYAVLGEALDDSGVLDRPDAVPEQVRVQPVEAGR